jgi:hypothetical protein
MKNIKALITYNLLLISGLISYGQDKPSFLDTLYINIENKTEVIIAAADYNKIRDTVLSDLKFLQTLLRQDEEFKAINSTFNIVFQPNKSLTINPFEPIQKIVFQDDKQSKFLLNAKCKIIGDDYTITIFLNDPDDLFKDGIVEEINRTMNDLPKKNRLSYTFNYSVQNGELIHFEEFDNMNGMMDYLNLDFGMGANLIKNKPIMDFYARVGLGFSRKGIYKNRFYTSANTQFMFDEEANINMNTFINLGYQRNFSNNLSSSKWLGFELGYLIDRNEGFYKGNTIRMGVNWKLSDGVTVSPQAYLEDGDKLYPALRLSFGL